MEDLKAKREAEEIPSFREALLQQTPQVVGEDIWQHCIDIQRKEVVQPAAAVAFRAAAFLPDVPSWPAGDAAACAARAAAGRERVCAARSVIRS